MKNSEHEESSVGAVLETIGKKLTQLRIEKGFKSHIDFAEVHDLPRVQYWRMEKGKANITLRSLCRVAAIHNITVDKFFQTLVREND